MINIPSLWTISLHRAMICCGLKLLLSRATSVELSRAGVRAELYLLNSRPFYKHISLKTITRWAYYLKIPIQQLNAGFLLVKQLFKASYLALCWYRPNIYVLAKDRDFRRIDLQFKWYKLEAYSLVIGLGVWRSFWFVSHRRTLNYKL